MNDLEFLDVFAALAAPFHESEVKTREVKGRRLSYVTARTVMNRLDEALGPAGWWAEYRPFGDGAVVCRLTIRLPDGSLLVKEDVGGISDTPDESDSAKSGFSDALKRAAAVFGVGRYLYGDGVPPSIRRVVNDSLQARERPVRPALHAPSPEPEAEPPRGAPRSDGGDSGRSLFGWLRDQDRRLDSEVLARVSDWGADLGYPRRMIDWDGDQAARGRAEARRLLASIEPRRNGRAAVGS